MDGSGTDVDRFKYGYDRNGNRTYRENVVATSYGTYFDEVYQYDAIDRLIAGSFRRTPLVLILVVAVPALWGRLREART